MSYIITYQYAKGKRRRQYDRETYNTKEASEQQLNICIEGIIKGIERSLEQGKLDAQEEIKNLPKQYTIKEI